MALAEGIARGLPAVAVAGGAIPEWLAPEAALLVPLGEPAALAAALRAAILDRPLRQRLRAGALRLRERLPSWQTTALAVERALLTAAAAPKPTVTGMARLEPQVEHRAKAEISVAAGRS